MNYHPRKILVTGGAGFIGSNFIQYQLQKYSDVEIINLDRLTYAGSLDNLTEVKDHPRYRFARVDICEQQDIENILLQHQIDTVIHFAAESHVDRSISGPRAFVHNNVFGTYSLLEAARQVWLQKQKLNPAECRFHHISTDEVYGSLILDEPAFTEQTPYRPNSPYAASKASSDHFVHAYHHTYGLPVTLSNCSNNYGPRQHQEKLIPTIIDCCLRGKEIPIYGNGQNIRDWLFVVDHCHAIDLVVRQGELGESYNIGGNEEHHNLAIVKIICELLAKTTGKDVAEFLKLVTFVTDRPGHDFRYAINATKIKEKLNWSPTVDIRSGLNETVKWYLGKFKNLGLLI